MPPERRTFGVLGYIGMLNHGYNGAKQLTVSGYWSCSGSNISAWTVGSTLLAFGLSPPAAIGSVV